MIRRTILLFAATAIANAPAATAQPDQGFYKKPASNPIYQPPATVNYFPTPTVKPTYVEPQHKSVSTPCESGVCAPAKVTEQVLAADRDLSKRYLDQGLELYKKGQYAESIDYFLEGYRRDKKPAFLFATAQAMRLDNQCSLAIDYYDQFLATEPPKAQSDAARSMRAECDIQIHPRDYATPEKATAFLPPPVKASVYARTKAEAEAKLRANEEAKAYALAEAKAKLEAEAYEKAQYAAQAKADAEARAYAEAEAKSKAQAVLVARAEAAARAKAEAEASANAIAIAEASAKAEAAARAKVELDLKVRVEALARSEAEMKSRYDEIARYEAEVAKKAEHQAKKYAEEASQAKIEADEYAAKTVVAEAEAREASSYKQALPPSHGYGNDPYVEEYPVAAPTVVGGKYHDTQPGWQKDHVGAALAGGAVLGLGTSVAFLAASTKARNNARFAFNPYQRHRQRRRQRRLRNISIGSAVIGAVFAGAAIYRYSNVREKERKNYKGLSVDLNGNGGSLGYSGTF